MSLLSEDTQEKVISSIHEWIRDCGLDVRDIEPFVNREIVPLLQEVDRKAREENTHLWENHVSAEVIKRGHHSDCMGCGNDRIIAARIDEGNMAHYAMSTKFRQIITQEPHIEEYIKGYRGALSDYDTHWHERVVALQSPSKEDK